MKDMKTVLFRHSKKSYLLTSLLGILAGALVILFSRFPADDLWGLAFFSSGTVGFWILTCSLLALFSERHFAAGIHTALYVFWMFYVTGVGKYLVQLQKGTTAQAFFPWPFLSNLLYGIVPALMCFLPAFVLWHGRREKKYAVFLRWMPAVCIAAEEILSIRVTVTRRQGLFTVLLDAACLAVYIMVNCSANK